MRSRAVISTLAVATFLAAPALTRGDQVFAPVVKPSDRAEAGNPTYRPGVAERSVSVLGGRPSGFLGEPLPERFDGPLFVHAPITRLGDGAGADVADLELRQREYSTTEGNGDGNVVQLVWTENTFNPPGTITILLDNVPLGTLDGLPEESLPARRAVSVPNVEPGLRTFGLEGNADGSFVEQQITVLDEQPFADPFNFRCEAGAVNEEAGTCDLVVRYDSVAPLSERFVVLYRNDEIQNPVVLTESWVPDPSPFGTIRLVDAPPGENCLIIIPFLDTEEGIYGGGTFEVCCDLTCEPELCGAPVSLQFCQLDYGAEAAVELVWVNGQPDTAAYVAVNAFVNGASIGSLSGAPEGGIISPLPAGDVDLGVQGDCGGGTTSDILAGTFEVLPESPHPDPITGRLECEFTGGELVANWTYNRDAPSSLIEVWVAPGGDRENLLFQDFLLGDDEDFVSGDVLDNGVRLRAALEDDLLLLKFRTVVDLDDDGTRDTCHSSPLIGCGEGEDGNTFVRGICNGLVSDPGNPTPQLTSAVFLFNFLFLGGPVPPCLEACDVDGEAPVNLTDGVFLLNFLFLSGPAPLNWADANADGLADPTCERAPAGVCATSAEYCP